MAPTIVRLPSRDPWAQQQQGLRAVQGLNVATSATIEEYALLRDQMWFGLQKWLKDGGAADRSWKGCRRWVSV